MRKVWMSAIMLTMACVMLQAQSVLKGRVTDEETGEPINGASVLFNDSGSGTVTNAQGAFELNLGANAPQNFFITVKHIGYLTKKLEVSNISTFLEVQLLATVIDLESVIVSSTRAGEKTPTTYNNVEQEDIEKQNLGQDLPFLLNWTPGVVTTSDAGAGIGYTGIRIRGSDPTRINVTVNGIPINDSESQGVFWVNMPDLATSVDNIQVQRGVGTSTNGAGAFGASINLLTSGVDTESGASLNTTVGSYGTQKFNAVLACSTTVGLLKADFPAYSLMDL